MANNKNDRIKVAGYARRIFFNDNIEYRNFSPDLVGLQFTSDGGTALFTNGNFTISTNLDPKPNVVFTQGAKSQLYDLDDVVPNSADIKIVGNLKTELNLDLSNPLTYIWYGSASELIRASLEDIEDQWPAAIYVDNKVGSVSGNNITDYVYDVVQDQSTFTVNSRYFVNPYNIKYTDQEGITGTEDPINPLRNFTVNYTYYTIEHNGIVKNIKSITPATQTTNASMTIVADGNPFPELTGIILPQFSFLFTPIDASVPFFIKPNATQRELFFSKLNTLQRNLLNRETYPAYKSIIIGPQITDSGVIVIIKEILNFPITDDGYNLNFFDGFYVSYLNTLNTIGENFDASQTDLIVRKYTAEAISSFDTIPRGDGNNILLDGEKATKLLRIYGVSFDEVKKFINGIKFAHTVTYNKKNNIPNVLVKDLSFMLGLDPITFVTDVNLGKTLLPSPIIGGKFSGTSTNYSEIGMDIELYRRLILNIAWIWKSKGTRKAIEFLFRFIGAPEALVNFNEYIVVVDEPLDMAKIKDLLYLYTGEVNTENIPYDDDGFPLPPQNGALVITDFITGSDTGTTGTTLTNSPIEEGVIQEMYFQKAGGWYRETFGGDSPTILTGNNPHSGPYDGGNEYLNYFSQCYIPNFTGKTNIELYKITTNTNAFLNYNYGIFNSVDDNTDIYTTEIIYNSTTGGYQPIDECLDIEYTILPTPLQEDGKTTLQIAYENAQQAYDNYVILISENSYLQYSSEWATIQSNLINSQAAYGEEVSSQEYVVGEGLINKTLEICITPTEEELGEPQGIIQCEEYEVVELDEFIYFTDSGGIKQNFTGIQDCCKKNEGEWFNFYDGYYNIGFCAIEDPCTGPPVSVTPSGLVVFDMVGNIMPENVITYEDKCYQYNEDCFTKSKGNDPCIECGEEASCEHNFPIINTPEFWEWVNDIFGTDEFYKCFTEVNCNSETIVSSPPCCLYYGYTPTQQTITYEGEVIKFYVCVDESSDSTPEDLSQSTLTYIIPNLVTDYADLLPATNMNATVNDVSSIYQYNTVLPEVGYYNSVYTNPPSLYSYFNDPDLMNPSEWVLESVDQQGRLSFYAYDDEGNKVILDWNIPSDGGSSLYEQVVIYNGYTLGGLDGNSGIDPNFIPCGDVDDVTIVFGAENYNGFKLPNASDCSCAINVEFDYMLKYDASNLINCAEVSCFPAVFDNLSQFNINCKNFIPFTISEEESDMLLQNFDDDPQTDEYVIWQEKVTQVEPNVECCEAFGGQVLETGEWNQSHELWTKQIKSTYSELIDTGGNLPNITNSNLNNLSFELKNIIGDIQIIVDSDCVDFSIYTPTTPPCPYSYEEYITTENICYLPVKEDCGLWTMMAQDYSNQLEWAYSVKADLEDCINNPAIGTGGSIPIGDDPDPAVNLIPGAGTTGIDDPVVTPISSGEDGYTDTTTGLPDDNFEGVTVVENTANSNQYSDDINYTLYGNSVVDDIATLEVTINEYTSKENTIHTQNIIMLNALTQTTTDLDCSIYDNQIKSLQSFNYLTYCKNNVIVSDIITYNNALNKCRESKFKEVTTEIQKYQELLTLCNSNNILNDKLIESKNQNQSENIIYYNNEIIKNDNQINTITNSLNNEVIDSDPAQVADQQNIIEVIATILGVSENSITVNGNLNISSIQKVKLNIKVSQNNQQITNIKRKLGQLSTDLNKLRNIQQKLESELKNNKGNNNLGKTLLTIGGAIIGTALIAKGFLDPETAGGLSLGIGNIVAGHGGPQGLAGCPDPNAQNYIPQAVGCGEGQGQYIAGNYTQAIQGGMCVMVNACCRKPCPTPGSGLGGGGDQNDDNFELGDLDTSGDFVFDPGDITGDDPGGDVAIVCEFCLAQSNDMAGVHFGPGPQPYEWQNPVFDNTGNYHTIREECCTKAIIGVPVQWYLDWSGQGWCITTDIGPGASPTKQESLVNGRSNCVFGIEGCMTPQATNYDINATIPCVDCCILDTGGDDVDEIIACTDPLAINYDVTATISCGNCCLYYEPCCQYYLNQINLIISTIETFLPKVESYRDECYDIWNNDIHTQFTNYVDDTSNNYLNYIDDLKLNFKLFVDNSNSGGGNAIISSLSYLPYCEQYNPFWNWDPTSQYSGIFITGTTADVAEVKSAIFTDLSVTNPNVSMNSLFLPQWKTFNFQLDECVCDDLRKLYPFGQFYIGVEIEDYECAVCLYVDNIKVNITDCEIDKTMVLNNCLIPQLSCVIDNKKSWVYTNAGITNETIYPNGSCNIESEENYTVTKMLNPVNRYWDTLEYRYTDYDINHSDLIINTKSATFAIDPANAIECDVYNFWREINCEECPTACETSGTVNFDGELYYVGDTLSGYTLELSGATTGSLGFSCTTYSTLLQTQVMELKNNYYTLTADLNASLNASYYDLRALGGNISLFDIENNNCNTNNIILGNNQQIDNLFGIIVEEPDSTISFLETYIYSATTPYIGGESIEIFSGVTAQTFNQTSGFNRECCETISQLLTDKGVNGLGLEKDYVWNSTVSACTWNLIDDCAGDCSYSGPLKVISREDCLSGITTGTTINVCVNPLDYLDVDPADIKVKDVFDEVVLHNLIDVKSRQVISDYPMLLLFYQLYLNANNCGKDLTGKLTYNNLFEFMDKIGDYWLDLIEQVVPATTIWEGCDNSGKLYRNTIFHQNKYPYRKYALNFNDSHLCPVSGITNESIGEASVDVLTTELSLFPTNNTINNLITQSNVLKDLIFNNNKAIEELKNSLCILKEKDTGPNVTNAIIQTNSQIIHLEFENSQLQTQLDTILGNITTQQNELVTQQQTFQTQFNSCNVIASGLTQAVQSLGDDFTPGTVEYERQRNYIAGLRHNYQQCIRKNSLLISTYDTVFITQIYSSNEYEGTVTVTGDPDWDPGYAYQSGGVPVIVPAGPFYNSELIHNCE